MPLPTALLLFVLTLVPPPGLLGRFGDPAALNGDVHLRLSPDGRYLLVGDPPALFDVTRGRRLTVVWPDEFRTDQAWFTPDGRLAYTGPAAVRVLDPATRAVVRQFAWPTADGRDGPSKVCLSPDGSAAALAWGHPTHDLIVVGRDGRPAGPALPGKSDLMALSADGSRVAVLTWVEKEVVVWETRTGKQLGKTPVFNPDDRYIAAGVAAFSPDGDTVAHFDPDCGLVLYAARGGGIRAKTGVIQDDLFRLQYAADGKTLTGWSGAGAVITYDADTAVELRRRTVKRAAAEGVADWDQSLDGRVTVVWPADGAVRVWVGREEKPRLELPYQGPVTAVGFGPLGTAVVVRGDRRFAWDVRTGKTRETPATERDRLALAAAGRPVTVRLTGRVDEPRTAEFVDPGTGKIVLRLPAKAKYEGSDPATAVGAGLVAVTQDQGVAVFDPATGKRRFHWPDPDGSGTSSLAFTPDGRFLLVGLTPSYVLKDGYRFAADGPSLVVLELATGLPRRTVLLPVRLRTNPVVQELWPDRAGRTVLVSLSAGALVLDPRTWRVTAELAGDSPRAVSPDGRWTVLKDGGLWDVRHPDAGPIRLTGSFIAEAAFAADGRRLIIGHLDGAASAWDLTVLAAHSADRARRVVPTADQLWDRLAGRDGEAAEDAITRLAARSAEAVALVAARLKPVPAADPAAVKAQIARLDAARFADREAATRWLADAGEQTEAEIRKALAGTRSAELRKRLEDVLAGFEAQTGSADRVRSLRAVELLERIGTPAARAVLDVLAAGAASADQTRAAIAARGRLGR